MRLIEIVRGYACSCYVVVVFAGVEGGVMIVRRTTHYRYNGTD